jgi:hypothetical protein
MPEATGCRAQSCVRPAPVCLFSIMQSLSTGHNMRFKGFSFVLFVALFIPLHTQAAIEFSADTVDSNPSTSGGTECVPITK